MKNKTIKKLFKRWTFNKYRRHLAYLLLLIGLSIKLYNCTIYGQCDIKNNFASVAVGDNDHIKMIWLYSLLILCAFVLNIYPFLSSLKKSK